MEKSGFWIIIRVVVVKESGAFVFNEAASTRDPGGVGRGGGGGRGEGEGCVIVGCGCRRGSGAGSGRGGDEGDEGGLLGHKIHCQVTREESHTREMRGIEMR